METHRLFICCVFKNEAPNLQGLIDSTEGIADHWTVVDTGSTDGTQDKLHELLGDKLTLIQDEWDDDFSRVRNIGLVAAEEAGADWCLVLDGDDLLLGAANLKQALPLIPDEVAFCGMTVGSPRYDGAAETFQQPRLFRASESIRYLYPVHAYPDLDRWWSDGDKKMLLLPECSVQHHGYEDKEHLTENFDRTIRILRAKMSEGDDATSLHRLYYEGRALMGKQLFAEAQPIVEELVERYGPGDNSIYLSMLARCRFYGEGDIIEALGDYVECIENAPGNLDLWFGLLRVASQGLYQIGAGHLTMDKPPPSSNLPRLPATLEGLISAHVFNTTEEEMAAVKQKVAELFPRSA